MLFNANLSDSDTRPSAVLPVSIRGELRANVCCALVSGYTLDPPEHPIPGVADVLVEGPLKIREPVFRGVRHTFKHLPDPAEPGHISRIVARGPDPGRRSEWLHPQLAGHGNRASKIAG